jgi:[acyl-carrier-protein] S-malonyltransferase
VVSNVTAEPVRDPEVARRLLVEQLTSPVRWTASMRTMQSAGVTRFIELGPGTVLAGLARRIERGADVASIGTADEVDSFLEG